jgi:GMP synthase-like glutamine amidotransferase
MPGSGQTSAGRLFHAHTCKSSIKPWTEQSISMQWHPDFYNTVMLEWKIAIWQAIYS